jgi:hypothetical protein
LAGHLLRRAFGWKRAHSMRDPDAT